MISKTKILLSLIFSLILISIPITALADEEQVDIKSQIYGAYSFYTEKNNINLLVTNLYESSEGLILDGYIYNTTKECFADISNFNLELTDANGNLFASQTFNKIDLYGGIFPLQGKKVTLLFDVDTYNLEGANLSCISWNFKYNYRFYNKN